MKRSIKGYKKDSPDKNEKMLLIPSGDITMIDVPFPVLGTDNLGNQQLMVPGKNYKFPGKQVVEIPIKQQGGIQAPQNYKPSTAKQRDNWNKFLDYLEAEKIGGSTDLDKRDKSLGLEYLKKYNKINPNNTVDESFIPIAQYESHLIRKMNYFPTINEKQAKHAFGSLSKQFHDKPISDVDSWLGSYTSRQYYPTFIRKTPQGSFSYGADFESYVSQYEIADDPSIKKQDGGQQDTSAWANVKPLKPIGKASLIPPIKSPADQIEKQTTVTQNIPYHNVPYLGWFNSALTKLTESLQEKEIRDYNQQMQFLENIPQVSVPTTQGQYGNPDAYQIGGIYAPEDLSYIPQFGATPNMNSISTSDKPINNKPVSQDEVVSTFAKDYIKQRESQGNYKAYTSAGGGEGAAGAYQFRWKMHKDWIKRVTGVKTMKEFLDNPEAQDKAFDYWDATTLTPWSKRIQESTQTHDSLEKIKTKIHFAGPKGALNFYSKGENTKDAFGTTLDTYQEGGEYNVSSDEILRLLSEGHEIEIIND